MTAVKAIVLNLVICDLPCPELDTTITDGKNRRIAIACQLSCELAFRYRQAQLNCGVGL